MEYYYIAMLVFLAGLACFDLFVGVSNDAVNFLNSAMGSRIASFRTTMWVATFGVLLGATFSSGMMEVARSGIFHPQMFNFTEVMIIFFAVMIADIVLLDTFNSLGLPTSTTVSIVFELLGSAIAAAAIKLYWEGGSLQMVFDYINTSESLTIISAILISVVVAFISGAVVQYIMRLIFSFYFERVYPYVGGVFGGLSITAIAYFLVMKGARGASFMQPEWIEWIEANTQMLVIALFVGFSILFQLLILVCKFNVFKIVILAGTFSLAFAFAGNDLVNFVGVPLAAYDSFKIWMASGAQPDDLIMSGLLVSTKTDTFFLLASGIVMVFTLWFSKKAHRVLQTALNLSSQQSDHEQFGSSIPGRVIVRASMGLGSIVNQLIPGAVKKTLDSRFKHRRLKRGEVPLPFDYVRASVNLVLSAALISSATSLQLPLSTTYVTFMVAMGSSFADGAWDRETAVYRISGVLTVISGWFVTALTASTLAAVVCSIIFLGGGFVAFLLAILAFILIIRSNMRFKQQEANYKAEQAIRYDVNKIREILNQRVGENLLTTVTLYNNIVETFLNDDIWDKYVEYANDHNLSTKSNKLNSLADAIKECAHSVGENQDTSWANNFVKFQICVLALANEDNYITRTLKITDSIITPQQLSANVEGTRSTSTKNNFYIHDFRMSYVLNTLKPYLASVKKEAFLPSFDKRTYKEYPLNFILYGAPGTGKTFSTVEYAVSIIEKKPIDAIKAQYENRQGIKKVYDKYLKAGRVVFTTFHQNYSYEDFIEGLRPDSNSNKFKFKAVPGVFKRIVASALEDKNNNYVLVIDEINRANISRVLGELITLLEDDKRWGEENQMMVVLPTSKDVFVVPNNLFIIGTMNTADKSISMIDVALRRRFSFIETPVDLSLISDNALRGVLEKINDGLKKDFGDGADLLVGHAYFINKNENDLDLIMNQSVIPLLYEYYFDKTSKVKSLVETSLAGTNFEIDGSATGRLRIKRK